VLLPAEAAPAPAAALRAGLQRGIPFGFALFTEAFSVKQGRLHDNGERGDRGDDSSGRGGGPQNDQ
jgi:hypothetical protein